MTDALTWIKSVCRQSKKTKHKRNAMRRCKNKSKPRQTRQRSATAAEKQWQSQTKLLNYALRCCCCPALPLLLSILSSVCSPTLSLLRWQGTTMKRKWNNGKLRLTRQKFLSEIICRRDRKVRAGQIHTHTHAFMCE